MDLECVKLDELILPDWNPRTISDKDMEKLKNSIDEFGYVAPLIVNRHNNHIVGGNQRAKALMALGYTEVDVVFIDEPDINKEKALNIALNKISGDWDDMKLEAILQDFMVEGFDIDLTGFDELDVNGLVPESFDYEVELPRESHTGKMEEFDETKQTRKTFYLVEGDVWNIGGHEFIIGEIPSSLSCRIDLFEEEMKINIEHFPDEDPFEEFEELNKGNIGLKPEGAR